MGSWDPSAIHAMVELAGDLGASGANIATIHGGSAVNAIAASAEMMVEERSPDESELDSFAARLSRLKVDPPFALRCEIVGRRSAGRVADDHHLVVVVRTVRRKLDLPDQLGSGSTDANAAIGLGIPAIALGCARGSGMHTVHERIELESLRAGERQLSAVIRELLPEPLSAREPGGLA